MKILFSSNHWDRFKIPMLKALLDANISAESIIPNSGYLADEIEFIIYSPDSKLKDFSPFVNLKAVLNLWAGVENIVENPTLKAPLYRLVDHKMSQGMLEWCTAHALRGLNRLKTFPSEVGTKDKSYHLQQNTALKIQNTQLQR